MKTALMITFLFLGNPMNIELALTPTEQATGMMYRQEWNNIQGMLFINQVPRKVSFWMKNTYLELSIFYLDKDLNIVELHQGVPLNEVGILSKSNQIQYILELDPKLKEKVSQHWSEFRSILLDTLQQKQTQIDKIQERSY